MTTQTEPTEREQFLLDIRNTVRESGPVSAVFALAEIVAEIKFADKPVPQVQAPNDESRFVESNKQNNVQPRFDRPIVENDAGPRPDIRQALGLRDDTDATR